MDLTTQICGQDAKTKVLAEKLERLEIKVDQPSDEHYLFYSSYHNKFGAFHAIAAADFLVTNGKVTSENALQLLYAVLKNKPIISLGTFIFSKHVDESAKNIIRSSISHMYIKDISKFDEAELRLFIAGAIEPVHYGLSDQQTSLIRLRVRSYFHKLSEESLLVHH